jgi:hypothetical protein
MRHWMIPLGLLYGLCACSSGGSTASAVPASTGASALSVTLPAGTRPPAAGSPGTVIAPPGCQLVGHDLGNGTVLYTSTENPCLTVAS